MQFGSLCISGSARKWTMWQQLFWINALQT